MQNKLLSVLFVFTMSLSLVACGDKAADNTELETYKTSMDTFFSNVEKIDYQIKTIDPDCDDDSSIQELFEQLDLLEAEFKSLSEIPVPKKFKDNKQLAADAYDYIKQANEYYHQSFEENSFNPYTLEAAEECYSRANKRIQYIVSFLHGEKPKGDNISYE